MHKLTIAGLALLIALPAWTAEKAPKNTEMKIAFVSMERIFEEYYKTKKANARLKARVEEAGIERKKLLADVTDQKEELETLSREIRDKSLSNAEREKKRQQLEDKYLKFKKTEEKLFNYNRKCKRQFSEEMRETQTKLVAEIREVIQVYVKKHDISIVLDDSGKTLNNVEAVIYYDKTMDITDDIIAILNRNNPLNTKTGKGK